MALGSLKEQIEEENDSLFFRGFPIVRKEQNLLQPVHHLPLLNGIHLGYSLVYVVDMKLKFHPLTLALDGLATIEEDLSLSTSAKNIMSLI